MARYLFTGSYSQEGLRGLIESPENRTNELTQLIESMSGTIESVYYAFGDHDVVIICDVPDNVSMQAISMAVGASGAVTDLRTTVLLSLSDGEAAARRAGELRYRPPGR